MSAEPDDMIRPDELDDLRQAAWLAERQRWCDGLPSADNPEPGEERGSHAEKSAREGDPEQPT